jgi:cob(I)alamin adenosyltransferase
VIRFARFVPLAFIAGQHGFLLFAPYLAFCLAALHVARTRRQERAMRSLAMATAG